MWNKNEIKIDFIRHGKTSSNERHCYIGITDESLSEEGLAEIKRNVLTGIYQKPDLVFVSPMKRAKETASIIFPDIDFIEIEEFREMSFGSFEGKNYEELKDNIYYRKWIDENRGATKEELEALYKGIKEDKSLVLPEKKEDFVDRSIKGFYKALDIVYKSTYANKNKEIATEISEGTGENKISILAHGGTIMAILSEFLKEDYYSYMVSCSEGISVKFSFEYNDGNIKVSHFRILNRICP